MRGLFFTFMGNTFSGDIYNILTVVGNIPIVCYMFYFIFYVRDSAKHLNVLTEKIADGPESIIKKKKKKVRDK